jgi:DNA polymerase I
MDAAILLPLHEALIHRLAASKLLAIAHLESQCLVAFAQMELYGMGLDRLQWQEQDNVLSVQLSQTLEQIHQHFRLPGDLQMSLLPECCDGINPNSSKQVKQALEALGIRVQATNQRTLLPIADSHPAVGILLEYRRLRKLSDSFYQPLLQHIHPRTGRVHPTWYQLGARSGRASCRDPALQTVPRDEAMRRCFVAKPGWVIVKADFNQIELRIVAKIISAWQTPKPAD